MGPSETIQDTPHLLPPMGLLPLQLSRVTLPQTQGMVLLTLDMVLPVLDMVPLRRHMEHPLLDMVPWLRRKETVALTSLNFSLSSLLSLLPSLLLNSLHPFSVPSLVPRSVSLEDSSLPWATSIEVAQGSEE